MRSSKTSRFTASCFAAGALLLACGPTGPGSSTAANAAHPAGPTKPPSATPATPATPAPPSRLLELPVKPRPELAKAFEDEGVTGTIALYDSASGELFASNPALAGRAFLPASTFKIPNSAIALELGILDNPDSPMPWDGKYSRIEDWNRDHTLRTAMQVSCVPCFQRVARQIGPERMKDWVGRFDYGNRDISGGIDLFWLTGALRITPVGQLDFLRRLDTGKLPITQRTLDIVRDILALDVGPSHVLYGKTGLVGPPEVPAEIGWFVGWVALGERSVYFATLLDGHTPGIELAPARRRVTERVLRSLAVLPG